MSDQHEPPATAGHLDQAAAWFAKLDRGSLSPKERQAFEQWIAADAGHRRAFDRVSQTWESFGGIARDEPVRTFGRSAPLRRAYLRRLAVGGIAAGILLAVGIGTDLPRQIDATLRADAATAVGETKVVQLADGSSVHLNTHSAIAVDYGPGETGPRRVRLLQGEATFDVAENPGRPFTVEAGGGESRALGTVFTVKAEEDDVVVTLHEGKVQVTARDGAETVLAANHRVRYRADGSLGEVVPVDPRSVSAWRRGKLVFQNRPLGEVVAELNRYHIGVIRLAGQALQARRVNGVFDTRDPASVVEALTASLDLRSTRLTSYLIFLHE